MADDKQFEATQSRLEKATREGDVARSHDVCAISAFAAGMAAAAAVAIPLAETFRFVILTSFRGEGWAGAGLHLGVLVLVPLAAAAAAATAAAALQGGLTVTWPSVKLERLSPNENIKRILSRDTAFAALRSAIAFACAAALAIVALARVASACAHFIGVGGLAAEAWRGSLTAAAAACAVAGLFAGGDYLTQLRRRRSRLRMSHDEMQRDRKEQEGDPLARSRRRSFHRQVARGSLRRVKDAAFVVVNPEHVAVALEYRPPTVPVPRVLVRAADELAARVRAIATDCGIPIVRNVALARQIYKASGDYIGPECYSAVAQIVAALHESGELK
jgi:flagellar biosynthesis protein FlhB